MWGTRIARESGCAWPHAQSAAGCYLRGIDEDRGRITTHIGELSREMARGNPDRVRSAVHAQRIRESSSSWQGDYQNMSVPLRLK